jgi:adenylate kinase family enzyme
LKEDFGFTHLSAGDLLREEQKLGGSNAQLIDMYIKDGKLVPSELIVKLIRKVIICIYIYIYKIIGILKKRYERKVFT